MKKSILIICIALTAFGLIAANTMYKKADPDLVYNVDSRFMTTITKENLLNAKSIIDILPTKATQSIVSYQSVQVDIIDETSVMGDSDLLNAAQLYLLQSADYSTNIYIRADYKIRNVETGELEDEYLTYYITIIPEKEAEFINGYDALIEYLRENSKDKTTIIKKDESKLQPGKVTFTVTRDGTIAHVSLTSTSGYPSVDETLIEMIRNLPENWNPATNWKGEKVDQKFVFFFGLQGC